MEEEADERDQIQPDLHRNKLDRSVPVPTETRSRRDVVARPVVFAPFVPSISFAARDGIRSALKNSDGPDPCVLPSVILASQF
jgi:hypothetical protein